MSSESVLIVQLHVPPADYWAASSLLDEATTTGSERADVDP
jgi:hypothetical protein